MAGHTRQGTVTGALWHAAAMVVPLTSTLLLSIVIARQLGPAGLGEQSLISYVGALVSGTVIGAATNCATQVMAAAYGAEDPGRFAALARLARRVHVAGGVLAAVVLAGVGSVREHALAWVLIGLVCWIDAVGWSHGSRLVALDGWRAVSPLRLVSQIAGSLLGVVAVLLGGGVTGIFAMQVLTSSWLAVVLRRRDRRARPDLDVAPTPVAVRPVARTWSLFVLSMLLYQVVDKRVELIFLDAFRDAHTVAAYAVAFTVVSVAITVPSSLAGAAVPAMSALGASAAGDSLAEHLRRAARLAVVCGFVLAAALVATGPAAVVTFWGPEFRDAAGVLPWLAAGALAAPLTAICAAYWTAVGRLVPVLLSGAAAAVIDLALAAALVPPAGLAGAVTANVAAQLAWAVLLLRHTTRRVPALLPSAGVTLRGAAVAVAAGGLGWTAAAGVAGAGALVSLLGGAAVFTVVLLGAGWIVGLLPAADVAWLAGALPARLGPALTLLGRGRRPSREPAGDPEEAPASTPAGSSTR
jgi:O-antigen/teichoic acid export membrane protein